MTELIRQRKLMAMGKPKLSGDFGIEGLSATSAGSHPDRGQNRPLGKGERHKPVRHTRNMMPAAANPDHGPTHYNGDGY